MRGKAHKNTYDKNWYRNFSDMKKLFHNFQRLWDDYEVTYQKFPIGLNRYK